MNKVSILSLSVMGALMTFAGPIVSEVEVTQAANRDVTITYKLSGEPAVVTMDICTNCVEGAAGASIGGRNLWYASGDVYRLVGRDFDFSSGAARNCKITWTPNRTEIGESGFRADAASVRVEVKAWATNCPPDYMVVTLDVPFPAEFSGNKKPGAHAEYYADASFVPEGIVQNPIYKETKIVMRKIPAQGVTWRMGTTYASDGGERTPDNEIPHLVQLTYDYYIGVFPVTVGQYLYVTGEDNPSTLGTQGNYRWYPTDNVSQTTLRGADASPIPDDPAKDSVLDKFRQATGVKFDLPKDAEWEYACRAGSGGKYCRGIDGNDVKDVHRLSKGFGSQLYYVGESEPNAWGVYDMWGELWEFTLDFQLTGQAWYDSFGGKGYAEPVIDPFVKTGTPGNNHVDRGVAYRSGISSCRAGLRSGANYTYKSDIQGFRLRAPAVAE